MKIIMILIVTICSLLLSGCKDYSDFKDFKIPDENIGSVKLPNNWVFEVIDEWIHIIDSETNETIGIQFSKGIYYRIGGIDGTVYDTRTYNPYFDQYEYITEGIISGNSNGGNYGYKQFRLNDEESQYIFLLFNGSEEHSYNIEIILIDNLIEESVISNIVKSYKR